MSEADPAGQASAAESPVPARTQPDRQQFWLDTCREATERRSSAAPVPDFYRKHGWRFTLPTEQQVRDILEALDAAMPAWEQQHPELFFQTLELNFPELVRQS